MPQVCFPLATDAKGQTFYEHVQGNSQVLLRPGAEEDEAHKTRHGAHTGSWTKRRSRVPVSEGSSARKVDRASRR
jgi:hypothetical protein